MKQTFGNQETQLCSLHNSITIKSKKCVLLGGMVLFRCLFFCLAFSCSGEIKEGQHYFHFSETYDQPIATVPINENKLINHLLKLMIM